MSELEREVLARLRALSPDPAVLGTLFDDATHDERVAAARALGRVEQRALYRAVDGHRPMRLVDLVPPSTPDGRSVRHHGKNSLPAFTHFEKRFCRPAGEDPTKPASLHGYNHQTLSPLTGPGYFVARPSPDRAEVWIDYREIPDVRPEGWPALRPNQRGLARLVYGDMVDTLRRVSEHVSIGSAARGGRPIGSWFVLVRED